MSNYQPHWDLTTIPDAEFKSEHGRRQRLKGPPATHQVLKACKSCGISLNSTQRRRPCPVCGYKHPRVTGGR